MVTLEVNRVQLVHQGAEKDSYRFAIDFRLPRQRRYDFFTWDPDVHETKPRGR